MIISVKAIRQEDSNLRAITSLLDSIKSAKEHTAKQIEAARRTHNLYDDNDPAFTSQKAGWIEMAELLDIAYELVIIIPLLFIII